MKDSGGEHFCKVCKRSFGCAGALGGHMRCHGVGGDASRRLSSSSSRNNGGSTGGCGDHGDKCISDFNYKRSEGGGSKHSYFLRKSNRLTSYRAGVETVLPAPSAYHDDVQPSSSESEEAEGILPAAAAAKSERKKKSNKYDQDNIIEHYYDSSEEEDLANCLVMLSNKSFILCDKEGEENKAEEVEKGTLFQCKACKKVFSSHQALGGHRASHKKVKGCYYAARNEDAYQDLVPSSSSSDSPAATAGGHSHRHDDLDQSSLVRSTAPKRKPKEHECSICHRVFSSGQALGGHKRCHWLTATNNFPAAEENTIIQNFQFDSNPPSIFRKPAENILLDLNSPPLLDNNKNNNNNNNNAAEAAAAAIHHHEYHHPAAGNNNKNSNIINLFKYDDPKSRIMVQQVWGNKQVIHADNGEGHDLNRGEEYCRRVKVAKLSDLKDSKVDGGSSGWLQVGITSTTEMTPTP